MYGPSLAQCQSAYSGSELLEGDADQYDVQDGIQVWTVPFDGLYRITAFGAGYNAYSYQKGAKIAGEFNLQKGSKIKILVGQRSTHQSGGSGGSFVATTGGQPLIVAGGAGGAHTNAWSIRGYVNELALAASTGGSSNSAVGMGGYCNGCNGRGGGGFYGDGQGNQGGKAFVNGGLGGPEGAPAIGGFGGGGSSYSTSGIRAGGGGGYSGGNGSSGNTAAASGGGSFWSGNTSYTLKVNGANAGNGKVEIVKVSPL